MPDSPVVPCIGGFHKHVHEHLSPNAESVCDKAVQLSLDTLVSQRPTITETRQSYGFES